MGLQNMEEQAYKHDVFYARMVESQRDNISL